MKATEILEELDGAAEDSEFPSLNSAMHAVADARLSTFRSSDDWLVVIEYLAFLTSGHTFANTIVAVGSGLDFPGTQRIDDTAVTKPNSASFWNDNGKFDLDLMNFEVSIRGNPKNFKLTSKDYESAGIDPDSKMPPEMQFLRVVAAKAPGEYFKPTEELPEICGQAGLEPFLILDEWQHPDIVNNEKPSEVECFKSLAEALASGKKNTYECPKNQHNVHWSNWDTFPWDQMGLE